MSTAVMGRLVALGRAEFTLLLRNRTAMFTALAMPVLMVVVVNQILSDNELLENSSLSVGHMMVSAGFGMMLTMVIYSTLVASYVTRREERVLKRLRTGEASDWQILFSTTLPVLALSLAQFALLMVAGTAVLDVGAPKRPDLLLAGVVLGFVLSALLAAATAMVTKTVESSQVTVMPLMVVSFLTSGMMMPLDAMPDTMANGFRVLPLTPVMELLQGGLKGGMGGVDVLLALGSALAWTLLMVSLVRSRFRWEPRR